MITIGSLFSGIGGLERGLEKSIPNSKTIWQVEKDQFCRSILAKHWPDVQRYNDIKDFNTHLDAVQRPTIICGGFPCQSISKAGKKEGLSNAKKSGLWYAMAKTIGILRPKIVLIENVSNAIYLGGADVLRSLAKIGYDAEWQIIRSAAAFGAPHRRERWFCVSYPSAQIIQKHAKHPSSMATKRRSGHSNCERGRIQPADHWQKRPNTPPLYRVAARVPRGLHPTKRLKALGNAVVPQCAEYIGRCILASGLLDD